MDEKDTEKLVTNSVHVVDTPKTDGYVEKSVVTSQPDFITEKIPLVDNKPPGDANGGVRPHKQLCGAARCQRPYTWYTTRVIIINKKLKMDNKHLEE